MSVQPIKDNETIRAIINYLKKDNPRNCLMFMFGIYTGLRISDILPLRVMDVYHKNGIRITEQKTQNKRSVIFHKELKDYIDEYCKGKRSYDYLIQSRQGYKPITRTQAYRILREVAERFGLDCIGTHTMRKTYGYHLYIQNNKDVVLVQKALQHSDPSITLHYIGVDQGEVYKATRNLRYY